MISFTDSEAATELAERARALMDEVVIPRERELAGGTAISDATVRDLRAAAREYDVYAPQIPEEHGGMGYDFRDVLPTFEEAGRSLLGPIAMRVDAPDEGNMHLLEMQGTDLQKSEYLDPLVEGEIQSGFAMTEPMQGAGSDPKMIRTTAQKDGDEWVIDGHKWWTTGGVDATSCSSLPGRTRTCTRMKGVRCSSSRPTPTAWTSFGTSRTWAARRPEGHAEIEFNGVRVPEEHLLGEEGNGFQHVQQRLGPARLTHCMRFSGMAERALSIAKAYTTERQAFGDSVADKQHVRFEIAEQETQIQAARALVRAAADAISAGQEARVEVSMSKVFAARATQDAIDTAVQFCGGNGIGRDLPLADFYELVRTFRIVDGADEVHLRTIAREAFEDVDSDELEPVRRYRE